MGKVEKRENKKKKLKNFLSFLGLTLGIYLAEPKDFSDTYDIDAKELNLILYYDDVKVRIETDIRSDYSILDVLDKNGNLILRIHINDKK